LLPPRFTIKIGRRLDGAPYAETIETHYKTEKYEHSNVGSPGDSIPEFLRGVIEHLSRQLGRDIRKEAHTTIFYDYTQMAKEGIVKQLEGIVTDNRCAACGHKLKAGERTYCSRCAEEINANIEMPAKEEENG